ncbi:MAG: hypothetical protein ACK4KX_03265 [Parvibaculum sp.]|uniref:hypothetical protein n=1 Tax=Parvibaculum sp. TaxID=2024848 RepID=UPI00391BC26D
MKDISLGSSATMNVAISDMSPQVLALQQGFLADALGIVDGALSGAGNLVSDALDSILVFAKDNADRNTQFAQATQASYASAVRAEMTNDLTQVLEKGMTTIAIIVGLYFAMQVLK